MTKRKKKTPVYQMTKEQIITDRQTAQEEGINIGLSIFLPVFCYALREEYGFAGKRLERVIDKIHEVMEDIGDGIISVDDITETLYKETGVKFERGRLPKWMRTN